MRPALHARARAVKKFGAATFPALSNPAVILIGDSITAKENQMLAIGTATLTRDGTTHPGRITAPITSTLGSTAMPGTPRVSIVNVGDKSFEVIGRNNYEDSTTTGFSIHTNASDTYAKGAPSWNSTTAGTTTQVLSNGDIIDMERRSWRGPTNHANAIMGGGMDIVANLGHPGALVGDGSGNLSAESAAELAYAKQLTTYYNGLGRQVLCIVRMGINDMKPGGSPTNTANSMKKLLDGLTGADGLGGNAYVVLASCSFVGSTASLGGSYASNPTGLNEQAIGKCATSGAPTTLNVDSSTYTLYDVTPRKTYNRQLYELSLANPGRILFSDLSTPTYSFASQVMYDNNGHLDPDGNYDTSDGTHFTTSSAFKQGVPLAATMTAAGITFPVVVPRSATDSGTPGGRTHVWLKGPWNTSSTTGTYLGGGSNSTRLPKGTSPVAGIPSGWVCGQGASATATMKCSQWADPDGLGVWINAECAGGGSSELLVFDPAGTSGFANLAAAGIGSATDEGEYEFVFELYWENALAAGIQFINAQMTTNGSGRYGMVTNGESGDAGPYPVQSPSGNMKISTGRLQMSNGSITTLVPQIQVKMGTVNGVSAAASSDFTKTANVGVRCVGINKLP